MLGAFAVKYDVVAVGTGFSTSFFLQRFLSRATRNVKVLVLDAGPFAPHSDLLSQRDGTLENEVPYLHPAHQFINRTPEKTWNFHTGFGGGSNCWYACTPRLLPEDFKLRSNFGVGSDWPITYEDLEEYYCDAEELMNVSGDSKDSPYPMSRQYPQEAHRFSTVDKRLKELFPDSFFPHPCARSPQPVPGQRVACCSNNACFRCPLDAKFTILNAMQDVYRDDRVTLLCDARVIVLEYGSNVVESVIYESNGEEHKVSGDLVVLGANGLFNPFIMKKSGLDHPDLGTGIGEQVSCSVRVALEGLDNWHASTISAGLGYMFYKDRDRAKRAAAMIQINNPTRIRPEAGKWLQLMELNFVFEDFRLPENVMGVAEDDPSKPEIWFHRHSRQTEHGIATLEDDLAILLENLPVEGYEVGQPWSTDSHIIGTTVMGSDPLTSVIDDGCIHHRLRNLAVLGSGAFPTAAPANPTLTIGALALRAADKA